MSEGGWSCPHSKEDTCEIIKKPCNPGDKGCVLFGKAKFATETSPSNEAFEKRMERKMQELLKKSDD